MSRLWKLLIPCAAVGLTLLVTEGVARIAAKAAGRDRMIVYDERLGWRMRPGVEKIQEQEQPYRVEINSHGLRDDELGYERTPGKRRALVLGDSFAFGFGGVAASERFSEIIEARRPNLEVINSGAPSYEPVQEWLYLRRHGLRYRPDLVLLTLFANDFKLCFLPYDPWIGRPKGYVSLEDGELRFHEPEFPPLYLLSQHSYLFAILDSRLGLRRYWAPEGLSEKLEAEPDERDKETYRKLIATIAEEARGAGARFAVVYFPAREGENGTIPPLVAEVADRKDFPFLDLTDALLRGDGREAYYFQRDVHFNAAGHRFVGEAIDREIIGPLLYP